MSAYPRRLQDAVSPGDHEQSVAARLNDIGDSLGDTQPTRRWSAARCSGPLLGFPIHRKPDLVLQDIHTLPE